ncbi:MAG: hypothetical protein AAGA45_00450 [Verrucomicrobiota bacterium]
MNPFKLITKPLGCLFWFFGGGLFLILIALAVALWIAKSWAPDVLANWMERTSGYAVRMDKTEWRFIQQEIIFEDIVITNPPSFAEDNFLRIRQLGFGFPYERLFSEGFVPTEVTLHIETLSIVIPPDGMSNVGTFIQSVSELPDDPALESIPPLQELTLIIDEVTLEYTSPGRNRMQKYAVAYEGTFEDVSDPRAAFAEVQHQLRLGGVPGLSPDFFEALFAALPIQCFDEIPTKDAAFLPTSLKELVTEETKKALEAQGN